MRSARVQIIGYIRGGVRLVVSIGLLPVLAAACGADGQAVENGPEPDAAPIAVQTATVVQQPITRTLRVTGSLMADEQAEVSAEVAGRVVTTPVERGSRVNHLDVLVTLSNVETRAQLAEAEANAAQLEARLGLGPDAAFDVDLVPDVANAQAALTLAEAEFARIRTLLDQRVVSQSEFDQRQTQVEAAKQQLEAARNGARQQWQLLQAAQARVDLARKALADTNVRAPFAGLVAERRVSVGDYVTRGTPVATVVRIHPLRLVLTVPEQSIAQVEAGAAVSLMVDAYPDRRFTGAVRYVSPALAADQRALTVEAIVPNSDGTLKPGLFATAEMAQPIEHPALLVPATAIQTTAGTSRVFVVRDARVQERLVAIGQTVGSLVEITRGVGPDEVVATTRLAELADGSPVAVVDGDRPEPAANR